MQTKIVEPSPKIKDAFKRLEHEISEAAKRVTGKDGFPISPFYVHEIPGADADMDRVLKSVNEETAYISAIRVESGIAYEVRW